MDKVYNIPIARETNDIVNNIVLAQRNSNNSPFEINIIEETTGEVLETLTGKEGYINFQKFDAFVTTPLLKEQEQDSILQLAIDNIKLSTKYITETQLADLEFTQKEIRKIAIGKANNNYNLSETMSIMNAKNTIIELAYYDYPLSEQHQQILVQYHNLLSDFANDDLFDFDRLNNEVDILSANRYNQLINLFINNNNNFKNNNIMEQEVNNSHERNPIDKGQFKALKIASDKAGITEGALRNLVTTYRQINRNNYDKVMEFLQSNEQKLAKSDNPVKDIYSSGLLEPKDSGLSKTEEEKVRTSLQSVGVSDEQIDKWLHHKQIDRRNDYFLTKNVNERKAELSAYSPEDVVKKLYAYLNEMDWSLSPKQWGYVNNNLPDGVTQEEVQKEIQQNHLDGRNFEIYRDLAESGKLNKKEYQDLLLPAPLTRKQEKAFTKEAHSNGMSYEQINEDFKNHVVNGDNFNEKLAEQKDASNKSQEQNQEQDKGMTR